MDDVKVSQILSKIINYDYINTYNNKNPVVYTTTSLEECKYLTTLCKKIQGYNGFTYHVNASSKPDWLGVRFRCDLIRQPRH